MQEMKEQFRSSIDPLLKVKCGGRSVSTVQFLEGTLETLGPLPAKGPHLGESSVETEQSMMAASVLRG